MVFEKPPNNLNWRMWSWTWAGLTETNLSQEWISCQIYPKKSQCKNKWSISSWEPHSQEKKKIFGWSILLLIKLSVVRRLVCNKRQTNMLTFKRNHLAPNGCSVVVVWRVILCCQIIVNTGNIVFWRCMKLSDPPVVHINLQNNW